MKGMMATLLTLTLAGFANGQQSQFERDNSGRQFGNQADGSYSRRLPMLANSLDKERIDDFRQYGEMSWSVDKQVSDNIGQIVFGYENPIEQFRTNPDRVTSTNIKPVATYGDTVVFEFSETDLKAIESGTLKYELDPREVGLYRNVVVRMRGFAPKNGSDHIREQDNRNFGPTRDVKENLMASSGTRANEFRSFETARQSPASSMTGGGWNDLNRIKDNYFGMGDTLSNSSNSGGTWDRMTRRDSSSFVNDPSYNRRGAGTFSDYNRDSGYVSSDLRNGFQDSLRGNRTGSYNDSFYRDSNRIGDRAIDSSRFTSSNRNDYQPHNQYQYADRFADASGLNGSRTSFQSGNALTNEEHFQRDRSELYYAQQRLNERDDRIERLIQQNDVLADQLRRIQNQTNVNDDMRIAQNDIPGRKFNHTPWLSSADSGGMGKLRTQIQGNGSGLNGASSPLYILLLCSLGLNAYLGWISRNFYVRYSELADELRETFSASISS